MATPPKECFGLHWDPNEVECKGGFDAAYTNPKDGTHRRDKCAWWGQCAARTSAKKTEGTRQNYQNLTQITRRPAPSSQYVKPQLPNTPQWSPQTHSDTSHQGSHVPPHVAYHGPQHVPVQYQTPGAQMPSYLANPEPINPNIPWHQRLWHEIFRSMMKSSGHTAASFFDHMTITRPKGPEDK